MLLWTLGLLIACYLLGSIPTGYILAKRLKGIDLRKFGSGSIGTTNAYRALGVKGASIVFVCDILKGTLAVCLAYFTIFPAILLPFVKIIFGLAAILGHNYPVFTKFKGGKGVATSCGVLLALAPQVTGVAFLLWLAVLLFTRFSSLASLTAAFSLPIIMVVYDEPWINVISAVVFAALVIFQHRDNIKRLMKGEETPLDFHL